MLHWSQDASTGWTRNSCRGSIAKVEDAPFELSPGRGGRAPPGRREDAAPVLEIYHPRPCKARDARPGPLLVQDRRGRLDSRRETPASQLGNTSRAFGEVDRAAVRSYARWGNVVGLRGAAEEGCGS